MSFQRLLPAPTRESKAFWEGGKNGELLIHRCADCKTWHHPPQPVCHVCHSWNVAPTPASHRAHVISFTVNHHPWVPDMPVPFVLAFVEPLESPGVWLLTNIIDTAVDAVHIGQVVTVVFEQHADVWLPLYRPEVS